MYIVANWKLNGDLSLLNNFVDNIDDDIIGNNILILAVPYYLLDRAFSLTKSNKKVFISSQDVSSYNNGAYTGEIGAAMLKEIGCTYSIIGHSERRKYFHDTNDSIKLKLLNAIDNNINPIFCVGENNRENFMEELSVDCSSINKDIEHEKIMIAYEPVWAIGSKKTPTVSEIDSAIIDIKTITNFKGDFLYGGSVSSNNIEYLLQSKMVNGFLIGGASLKLQEMLSILDKCNS
ncbi:triosephosphate isomerase [Anaplasmataceae bacterium AB001_6]|nr:triosephosphate isomerase [Anaplasmataceae bacterium AB001_6]